MRVKLPTEEVRQALDNCLSIPNDQQYRYTANFFPAGRLLDRHIINCRNQQVVKNWTTSPGLHRSTDINLLDSNMYFNERYIRQMQNGTHVLLKKFDTNNGSIDDFIYSMTVQYESQMYADRTCIINLSFSEN